MGAECFQQPRTAGENDTWQMSSSLVLCLLSLSLKCSRNLIMPGWGMQEQRKPAKSLRGGAAARSSGSCSAEDVLGGLEGSPGLGTAWAEPKLSTFSAGDVRTC